MNAKWVEVLHITNGDTVVIFVSDNLILYLLPALQGFLYQHLWRERKGLLGQLVQLLLIVAEARTQSA